MKSFKRIAAAVSALAIMSTVATYSISAFAEYGENNYEIVYSSEYDVLTDETTVVEPGIAAQASTPKIVCDIVYNSSAAANRKYRVDVKFSGMPDLCMASFHVNVGSGWNITTMSNGGPDVSGDTLDHSNHRIAMFNENDNNTLFLSATYHENRNFNGTFASFYVTKKSNNTPSNSAINISFITNDNLAKRNDINPDKYDYIKNVSKPVMLQANQYIIGDANGDGFVNALDSSTILTVTKKTPSLNVYSIRKTYKNYFPNAASPSAPDADRSGVINSTDANKILDYYSAVATGKPYTGSIGKIDVYEIFN